MGGRTMDEMNEQTNGRAEGETIASAGDLMPHGTGLPRETARREEPREPIGEGLTVRYRRKRPRGMAGLFLSVLILLFAVLLAVMAMGRSRSGDGGETTDTDASTTGEEHETQEPTASDLYRFDPSAIPEGHIGIRPYDLSGEPGTVTNLTGLSPDLEALSALYSGDGAEGEQPTFSEPLVLILHTHTTEAYSAAGAISWDGTGELARSLEDGENVIAVGALLTEALNARGIPTLHATLYHDVTETGGSYLGSYDRSGETVRHYLALYPSIRYVIDLHRDAILDGDGNLLRAVTEVDGEAVAQVMAVVGSGGDDGSVDWERNLAFALAFTESLGRENSGLARAPALKDSSYGQENAELGIVLEFGTAGNTLDEAKRAVAPVADALAEVIGRIEGARAAE